MAATSSAAAYTSTTANYNSNYDYDVFISHRGPDVKKTFASHLYRRLLSYGLRVFLDQPELERGDYFIPQIEGAILSASVHVAIFSSGYADSKWCLDELLLMLDSKAPIIPVFYHVKPNELRWTQGSDGQYAQALQRLEKKKMRYDPQTQEEKLRHDSHTVEKWRNALSTVADISGFELDACNGDEGELVEKVVEQVLKKVKKLTLDVAKYPTGLDDKVKDFENTVLLQGQQSGKPQILGIVGLGGVGKTTLAKEFFNRKNSDYSRSCFLFDVRDNACKGSLNSLQRILIKSLTGSDNPINSVDDGIGRLRMHLSSVNALVIIDDVDHVDQVDALLPHQTVLHSNSLILITSRNKDVLTRSVENTSIYHLSGLNTAHARELFCSHAFNKPYPLLGFESLVEKFLKACNGLPLSLKVFGALLYGKDISYCEDQLESLQQILPTTEIHQRFKISYNSLTEDEQHIFLDIACFLRGQSKNIAIGIWDGSGWKGRLGFENLENKSLVEVNSLNEIYMHDHLRDLGREIAKASRLRRRLWRWTEDDIDDLLQQSSVISVRGIRMFLSEYNDIGDPDAFGRMKRLQLLDSEDVLVEHILTKVQSPNLIWLRWNNCPYSALPSWIPMKNLRALQVQGSKLEILWEKESQVPLQLRELKIEAAPLSNIPNSIGQLKHLERIIIGSHLDPCFHPTVRTVNVTELLTTVRTVMLTKLPEEFCLLQSLNVLVLEGCSQMKSLPECFGNLTGLEHIDLSGCVLLKRLPDSFDNLTRLQLIKLSRCSALEGLPVSFGNLTSLHHIGLSECDSLERLPDSFCKLIKLQYLDLEGCCNLTMSRETLGNISTLEYINLHSCGEIKELPPQVAHQRSLEQLKLGGTNIKELPNAIGELSYLEVLEVGGPLLDTLPPSLGDLKKLKELSLSDCTGLKCLPASLGDLRNLKILKIFNCEELKCLPASIGQLTQLTELRVEYCPLIGELPFLYEKEVRGERETLSNLDSSCILPRLQRLDVSGTEISEVSFAEGVCFNLGELNISYCDNVVEVGTLPNTLVYLNLGYCGNLRKIDKIYGLPKLQLLTISGCKELEELPHIETLASLSWLLADGCVKLKSIRGLGQLTNLQQLWVDGCSELEEMEGIQDCKSLHELQAYDCPKLQWSAGVVEQLRQRVKHLDI